jgi:hypothetical protein
MLFEAAFPSGLPAESKAAPPAEAWGRSPSRPIVPMGEDHEPRRDSSRADPKKCASEGACARA